MPGSGHCMELKGLGMVTTEPPDQIPCRGTWRATRQAAGAPCSSLGAAVSAPRDNNNLRCMHATCMCCSQSLAEAETYKFHMETGNIKAQSGNRKHQSTVSYGTLLMLNSDPFF